MRIVIDTNILLISLPSKSKYHIIIKKLLSGEFTLVISNEILSEYNEIIDKKTNSIVAKNVLEMLLTLENVSKQEIYYSWNLIKNDYDDNKFVDCAIAGNVDFIVTNDRHFDCLIEINFPKLNTLKADEFIEILNKKS